MFQTERFTAECLAAIKESDALSAVKELVARDVSEPAQVLRALGEPERSGVQRFASRARPSPRSAIVISNVRQCPPQPTRMTMSR